MHVATAARLDSRATWQTHDRWREGWGVAFAKRVYTAEFGEGASISDRKVLGAILREIGQDADRLLARAGEPEVKERLRQQTEEAQELGIFGAPSFVARGELYWGDDRLEAALAGLTSQVK